MIFDFVRFDDTSHEHKQSSSRRNDSVRTRRSQAASRFTPSFVCLLLLFCPVPQDLRFFFAREPAVRIVHMCTRWKKIRCIQPIIFSPSCWLIGVLLIHSSIELFFRENARDDDDRNYERASERHCPRLSSLDSWVLCLSLTSVCIYIVVNSSVVAFIRRRRSSSFLETPVSR